MEADIRTTSATKLEFRIKNNFFKLIKTNKKKVNFN